MLIVGLSWLVYWLMVDVFSVETIKAALVTGLVFIILGLLVEGVPNWKRS